MAYPGSRSGRPPSAGRAGEARRAFGDSSPLVGQTVQDAREVLIHDTRTEETRVKAAEKMAEFAKKHEGRSWVNTMARDFARATNYLQSPDLPRTSGTAERAIKELRLSLIHI